MAKAASIFATGLIVSLGLCGINFVLVITAGDRAGIVPTYMGISELIGLAICAIGLLIVGLMSVFLALYRRFAKSPNSSERDQ